MTLTRNTLASAIVAVALAVTGACSPATPAAPTYSKDVGPIFAAHCNRCHSATGPGGSFQGDPEANPPKPLLCNFDFYDGDPATCAAGPDGGAPPASCTGAHTCAGLITPYIERTNQFPMPPPPATKLSDWELEVLQRWSKNPMP